MNARSNFNSTKTHFRSNHYLVIVMKLKVVFSIMFLSISLLSSCFTDRDNASNLQKKDVVPVSWKDLRGSLSNDSPDDISVWNIESAQVSAIDITDMVAIFYKSKDEYVKEKLLTRIIGLDPYTNNNQGAVNLIKTLALSDDKVLAPIAVAGFLRKNSSNFTSNSLSNWDTWGWDASSLLMIEEASTSKMYRLSKLTYLEVLRIAERYPQSKLTQGAIDYRNLAGGKLYFGYFLSFQEGQEVPLLRVPFNSEKEISFWNTFLRKYPDHPGSDDALFRLGRAYELQEDYKNSVISYFQSAKAPDGKVYDEAMDRFLLIVDLILSKNELESLISSPNLDQDLKIILEYSLGINLIREGNLSEAKNQIIRFRDQYKAKRILNPIRYYRTSDAAQKYIMPKSRFWENLDRQISLVSDLERLRSQPDSDKKLYEEATFWLDNYLTSYNYYWRGTQSSSFTGNIPSEWSKDKTLSLRQTNLDLMERGAKNYKLQNGLLNSIQALEKLLLTYPNSSLREKAEYSIGLNYYVLDTTKFIAPPLIFGEQSSWREKSREAFKKFRDHYPNSNLADDAYLAGEGAVCYLTLYPNGDRKKSVQKELDVYFMDDSKERNNNVRIGINVGDEENKVTGVKYAYVASIVRNSPAFSVLKPQDIILSVEGTTIFSSDQFLGIIRNLSPDTTISIEVERCGKREQVKVTAKVF